MQILQHSLSEILSLNTKKREKVLANLQVQDYINCEDSFLHFVKAAWNIVEPGRPFISNWHIESICDHLEAVARGEILNLVINVPPGTCKSMLVSTMWPVWLWIKDARKRIISISHNDSLPIRDARKARKIIESEWFRTRWGDKITFSHDQNQKKKYENTEGGYRQSFGITAGITGEKADITIIDDPHDAKTAMFSNVERQSVINAFDLGISTRGIDDNAAIVIIMQRLHEDDLSGHVLKEDGWEHLMFPMEYEPDRKCSTCLRVQDIRTEEGELLWPEYHGKEKVEKKKKRLRPVGVAGQFQQRPAPADGGIVNINWFKRFREIPAKHLRKETIQVWDTAQKADEIQNDPSVCGTWVRTDTGYYLIDVFRKWLTQPQLERAFVDLYNKYKPHRVIVEDKSSGSGLIQHAKEETTIPVLAFEPEHDKVTRLSVESGTIEAGNVFIPEEASWVFDFLQEVQNFPNGTHDDQCDLLSMALKYFRDDVKPAFAKEEADTLSPNTIYNTERKRMFA